MRAVRYNDKDKRDYLWICQRYNREVERIGGPTAPQTSTQVVRLSLQIHAAKANVPKRWRTAPFVKSCGMPV